MSYKNTKHVFNFVADEDRLKDVSDQNVLSIKNDLLDQSKILSVNKKFNTIKTANNLNENFDKNDDNDGIDFLSFILCALISFSIFVHKFFLIFFTL